VCLASGCSKEVHKPPPPDMRRLIEQYEHPTAVLDDATIPFAYAALEDTFGWLQAVCGWDESVLLQPCDTTQRCHVCQGLDPASQAFDSVTSDTDQGARELSRRISGINGYFRLNRVCPGFGPTATNDPDNGTLNLVIGFTSRGIDPVFGGTLNGCKLPVNDVPTTLDGDLSVAFERPFFLDEVHELEPIIRFDGRVQSAIDDTDFMGNLQISTIEGGDVAVVVDVPDIGSFKFFNGISGRGIEAANGRFSCTLDGPTEQPLRCQNVATGERVP